MPRSLRKRVNEIFEDCGSVESLLIKVVDETLKEILGKNATEIIYARIDMPRFLGFSSSGGDRTLLELVGDFGTVEC